MLTVEVLMPNGQKAPTPNRSEQFVNKMIEIIKAGNSQLTDWTIVGETNLEMRLEYRNKVPCLLFQKDKQIVYANVFCFGKSESARSLREVAKLYVKLRSKDLPLTPDDNNWIHLIPVEGVSVKLRSF